MECTLDTMEFLCRVLAWAGVALCAFAFWLEDSEIWKWGLYATLIVTALSVDIIGKWVPDDDNGDNNILIIACLCRAAAWILWACAVIGLYEWLWISGGILWFLNALAIIYHTFNNEYSELFDTDGKTQMSRRLFRLIVHDVVTAGFVCALGYTLGDVFDGDADDSQWRSLLSAAVIFQLFYIFVCHWGELRTKGAEPCCGEHMFRVWVVFARFCSFITLFVVILLRTHEDRVLVKLGIGTGSLVASLCACVILATTSYITIHDRK